MKQLKRPGVSIDNLLCYYTTVVRPVLEYACPIWQSSLIVGQQEALQSLHAEAGYQARP